MSSLADKSALVIGAATGIGRAVSEIFSAQGAAVMIADHGHEAERTELVALLRAHGGEAFDIECDVRKEALVAGAVAATLQRFGKLDILVNNAGVGTAARPLHEQDWDAWDRIIDINLKGVAYGMKHGLPPMIARGYGRVINTASQLAHKPAPFYGAYCASKAAVVSLTVSVAMEVVEKGITVNCVCPGPTDTAMWRAGDPAWNAWKEMQLPIKRVGRPDEIAAAYAFLASDQASYMVGQSVSPNGGDVMW
jgi:NAD(P)-dependent dehydrogenase (short-subunit alcohol dehydrogenase family)